MEEFSEIYGFRIIDRIEKMEEFEDLSEELSDDTFLWKKKTKKRGRRKKYRGDRRERINHIKDIYLRAKRFDPEEISILRSIPRFKKNINLGKNWTLWEDLFILSEDMTKKELARFLDRTPHSIRKRWSVLRQYGLNRRSVLRDRS